MASHLIFRRGAIVAILLAATAHALADEPAASAPTAPAAAAGEKIRVACVGDSIYKNRQALGGKGWPYYLGEMLKQSHDVQTFSANGVDCLRIPSRNVWGRNEIKKAAAFKPNVVIIMLGTNMGKEGMDAHAGRYAGDYRALIAYFTRLPEKPKIVLCTPIPVYQDNFGIRGEVVRNTITPIIERVAKEDGHPLIDTYTPMKDKGSLCSDGVHPDAEGLQELAKVIYAGWIGKPAPAGTLAEPAEPNPAK